MRRIAIRLGCWIAVMCCVCSLSAQTTDLHFDYVPFDHPNTPGVTPHFGQAQLDVLNYPSINGNKMLSSTDAKRSQYTDNNNQLAEFYNNFLADYNSQPVGAKDPIAEADKINAYTLKFSNNTGPRPNWMILNEISASLWPQNPGDPNLSVYRKWVVDCVTRLHDTYGYTVVTYAPFPTVGTGAGSNAPSWQALAAKSYIGVENYLSGEEVMNGGTDYASRVAWAQAQYLASKTTYTTAGVPFDHLFLGEDFAQTVAGTGWGRAGLSASDWDTVLQIRQDAIRAVGFPGFLAYSWGGNGMLIGEAEQIQHEYWYRTRLVLPGQQPQWLSDGPWTIGDAATPVPLTWNEQLNWLGGVPNAPGAVANFYRTNTAARSITLDGPKTVGVLSFDSPNSFAITAGTGGDLTLDNSGAGATVTIKQGSHSVWAPVSLADNATIDVTGSFALTGGLNNSSGKSITKTGTGILTISGTQSHGSGAVLNANAGVMNLNSNANGNLSLNANSTVNLGSAQNLAALNIAAGQTVTVNPAGTNTLRTASLNDSGKIDLNDNSAILDYSGASPIETIRQLIQTGYNNGSWDGDGITSTAARLASSAATKTSLAYAEAFELGTTIFDGQSVDSTTVLVKYTLAGDADLNGIVNASDLKLLTAHLGQSGDWYDGDFDYNNIVNQADYNLLAANLGQSNGGGGPAAVPLPAPAALAGVGLLLVVARQILAGVPRGDRRGRKG